MIDRLLSFSLAGTLAATLVPATAQQPAPAVPKDPLVGSWQGTLVAGPQKLEVALHVAWEDGAYAATFDSITQGVEGIPVSSVERDGADVTVEVPAIRGSFTGALDER